MKVTSDQVNLEGEAEKQAQTKWQLINCHLVVNCYLYTLSTYCTKQL